MTTTATARREAFAASSATTLRINAGLADVAIRHEQTDTATVEVTCAEQVDLTPVEIGSSGDVITVRIPALRPDEPGRRGLSIGLGFLSVSLGDDRVRGLVVTAVVPDGASLDVEARSGDVLVTGRTGRARIRSGSGDVGLGAADEAIVTSGSGDVVVAHIAGAGQIRSGSGDVRVQHCSGTLTAGSGSGDLVVDLFDGTTLTLRSASGDVSVGVPEGVPVWQDVQSASGDVLTRLRPVGQPAEGERYLTVRATTASGDVTLSNA